MHNGAWWVNSMPGDRKTLDILTSVVYAIGVWAMRRVAGRCSRKVKGGHEPLQSVNGSNPHAPSP
jgi:hypothetical protein